MITADKIDTTALNEKLNSLHDALLGAGKDVSTIVKDEARRLTRTIVNFIPPIKSHWGNPKASGEGAIRRELQSLFSEASPKLIANLTSRFGVSNVSTFITDKDGTKQEIQWDTVDTTGARMKELHHAAMNRRGKVPLHKRNGYPQIWSARVVVPQGTREPYIKATQKKVGKGKASMAKAGVLMGDKYPRWIADHINNNQHSVADISKLEDPTSPSVTFGSSAPGIDRLRSRIQSAVRFRATVVGRRIKLILSDYKGDFARGRKAQAAARKRAQEQEEAVE